MKKITLLSDNHDIIIKFINDIKEEREFFVSSIFLPDDNNSLSNYYDNIKTIKYSDLEILNNKIFKNFKYFCESDFNKYYNCKKTFFKMLDFHTHDQNLYTSSEKDKLFIKTLNFILNFLKEESPDIIINLHIPHNYFEVLLAEVCEINKIKHIFVRHFGIPSVYTLQVELYSNSLINEYFSNDKVFNSNYSITHDAIINSSKELKKNVKLTKKNDKWQNNSLIFLDTNNKFNILFFLIIRVYILFKENFKVFIKIILNIFKKNFFFSFQKSYYFLERLKVQDKELHEHKISNFYFNYISFKSDIKKLHLIKKYKNFSKKPNLDDKFIFFPLWYQPSASTYPFAEKFMDNINVIKLLIKNNRGLKIYVKEHEDNFNLSRHAWVKGSYSKNIKFYEEMSKMKGLSFINFEISDSELMDKSFAIATQPSKNSLISTFRKKPVLMFGHSLLNGLDGIFNINDQKDLNTALSKIGLDFKIDTIKQNKFFNILSQFSFLTDKMNSFNKDETKTDYKDMLSILKKIIYLERQN